MGCGTEKEVARSQGCRVGRTRFQVRPRYVLAVLKVLDLSPLQFCWLLREHHSTDILLTVLRRTKFGCSDGPGDV